MEGLSERRNRTGFAGTSVQAFHRAGPVPNAPKVAGTASTQNNRVIIIIRQPLSSI